MKTIAILAMIIAALAALHEPLEPRGTSIDRYCPTSTDPVCDSWWSAHPGEYGDD